MQLNTSYGLKNGGIVFIWAMSQSLTCSVVTGEGSYDEVLRNDIYLTVLKAAVNLEDESVMVFSMVQVVGIGPLVRLYGKINCIPRDIEDIEETCT